MRLTLATLLLMASSPAWAGDVLVSDGAAAEPSPGTAAAPAAPAAPPVPYAGLYDAPLFGHAAPAAEVVDETALRFYAGEKNRTRVDAEIRRLRALHPAWRVPANLYAAGAGNDEQPLWDLFAAGRTEELRAAIQAREKREAGWRPSADLLAKMGRAETAASLRALSDAHDFRRLLALAAAHPDALSCAAMDLDWRVAEAFAATGAPERAYEVDAAILKGCRDRDERLATVRKAVDLLPAADVDRLIAAGTILADGSGEFDDVRLDVARRAIGRALASSPAGEEGASAGGIVDEVPAAGVEALGAAALRSEDPADAALLGWYAFRHGRWAEADGWFKLGLQGSGEAKMAEGHALSLKELGRLDEAERLAHAWRERSPTLRSLFVSLMTARLGSGDPGAIDPAEMADFTAILDADRSPAAAGALGWAAYGRGDFDAAALWFGRAVDWTGSGELPNKVAEGYGLALKRLGRFDAAEDFLYGRRDLSAGARDLYVAVATAALAAGHTPGLVGPELPAPELTPERVDRFAEAIRAARSAPGAAAMGWRELRENRPAGALDWFRAAADWSPDGAGDTKAVEGLVLALKADGRPAEAEEAAFARAASSAQLRGLYRSLMVEQLSTPALAERLTPERVLRFAALAEGESFAAGAEALGWYRLGQGDCGYGVDWFRRALAWSPDGRGTDKAAEGLARALARAGHDAEADDVAAARADRAPGLRALDVEVMGEAITRALFPFHPGEDRLARFSALVRAERSAPGARALAWFRYRDAGTGYGVDWFADALRWAPDGAADAKTVEGYASALRDVGRLAEAEEALWPFVDRVPLMRDLYIDTVVSELTLDNPPEPMPHERLARFIAVATPLRSAAAAQALGWYRFARREYADSVIWFKYAVDWWPALGPDADRYTYVPEGFRPTQARLAFAPEDYRRTPRAFTSRVHGPGDSEHRYVDTFGGLATTWTGYALALREAGRPAEAEDIAFRWRDRWPALNRVFVDMAVAALTAGNAGAIAPERLKRYAAVVEEERDPGGAAALGWAAAKRHDPAEAAVWLKAALDWRPADAALDGAAPDGATMAGYVDALRASGRAGEAFAAASAWAEQVPALKPKLFDAALDVLAAPNDAATPPERIAEALALAEADAGPRGPAALGWHHLGAGRPADALRAFGLAVTRAADAARTAPAAATAQEAGGDVLAKSVEGYALALRAVGRDADALTFVEAWSARLPALASLPGDVATELAGRSLPVAPDLLDRAAALVLQARSVPAAAAFGWSAYGRRDWGAAADWFARGLAWSPDGRGPAKLVEGYAASLHNACRFAEAERAALSRPGEDEGGRLRTIYVDTVADRVSRTRAALDPDDASRFASATMALTSPNGAQALGWYAYRSRQFAAAAAWFQKALAWRPTEAEAYGLALSYRRMGDGAELARALSTWEGRFASLSAVRRAGLGGREPPLPDFGDLGRRGCAPAAAGADRADAASPAPAPQRVAAVFQAPTPVASVDPTPVGAVSMAAAPIAASPGGAVAPVAAVPSDDAGSTFHRRPIVVAAVESGDAPRRAAASPAPRLRPAPPVAERHRATPAPRPAAPAPRQATAASAAAPSGAASSGASPEGAAPQGSAAAALSATDDRRCLAILGRHASRSAGTRETEGWCLLRLDRPAEAAEAFRAAGASGSGRVAGDSALGATLSHLREGDTAAAVDSAATGSLPAGKRRELGLQILSRQAYDAYRAGRWAQALELLGRRAGFAAEPRDMTMLRGWSHYHLGDLDAARAAFTAADGQLSDHDSRNALAVVTTAAAPKAFR